MRAISVAEMKKLEDFAVNAGIPTRILMENAGKAVASTIISSVKWIKRAVIFIGKGNNGGDGLVAARYLHNNGIKTDIFIFFEKNELSDDTKTNLQILENIGVLSSHIKNNDDIENMKTVLLKADVVVDAVYGTGFKGKITGIISNVLDVINNLKSNVENKIPYQVVSIDCPSGVDLSSDNVDEHSIRADITVTFEYYKEGMLRYPASKNVGKMIVSSIGIPKPNPIDKEPVWKKERSLKKEKIEGIEITDAGFVASVIPRRKVDDHKGSCGKVLLISGSPGMTGASVLCGQAALRVGAGLVTIGVPKSLVPYVDSMSIETITWGLPETKDGTLSEKALDAILEKIEGFDVIAIGPGLSKNKDITKIVNGVLSSDRLNIPIILDADAINSTDLNTLKKYCNKDISITPHPGEMSRLINAGILDIQSNRIGTANKTALEYGINIILKGSYSVISSRKGELYVNPTGGPAMASAGVGDVLTGIISGLIAQGASSINALIAGAYIHGMTGDVVAGVKGERGVIASDLLDSLPFVVGSIIKSS